MYNATTVQLAFQRLSNYVLFSEKHRNILMHPHTLTATDVRACYSRLGMQAMQQLDSLQRRVLTLDLSTHSSSSSSGSGGGGSSKSKRDSSGQTLRSKTMNNSNSSKSSKTEIVDHDYICLMYYLCHSCLFDDYAVTNGVVVVINLNYIGPIDFKRAFPSSARKCLIEMTNGISCFKMKGCYLLHEPWWVKGMLSMVKSFLGSKKLQNRLYKKGKEIASVAEAIGREGGNSGGGGGGGGSSVVNVINPLEMSNVCSPEVESNGSGSGSSGGGDSGGTGGTGTGGGGKEKKVLPWTDRFPPGFCDVGTNTQGDRWLKIGSSAVCMHTASSSLDMLRRTSVVRMERRRSSIVEQQKEFGGVGKIKTIHT